MGLVFCFLDGDSPMLSCHPVTATQRMERRRRQTEIDAIAYVHI
jgi:hypothetical protein